MANSLSITYQGQAVEDIAAVDVWLNMEQDIPEEYNQSASLADLAAMVARARGGLSAKTYQQSGVEVTFQGETVSFPLYFYVWPSALGLPYSLSANQDIGVIDQGQQVSIEREGNVVVPMATSVDLPYLIEMLSATWDTPCYNELSEIIGEQGIGYEQAQLLVDTECFGVIRLRHLALGYRHTCTVTLTKPEASKVSDINLTVFADYTDADGVKQTEELSLEIPQAIQDYMATCPDGGWVTTGSITSADDGEQPTTIYYSTCTGNVL